MKIPKEIKIGGHVFSVSQVKAKELSDSGDCDCWHHSIRINVDGTPESNQAETLLHEIIEAISRKNNLKLDHTVLTVLSESLFAVSRDNGLDFSK